MHNDNEVVETDERRFSLERSLGVSPIDMRQRKFSTAMRGYEREEVTAFLTEAAVDYENALRENDRLRQEIVRLKTSLNQFKELEGSLKSTLMSAQKVADDMHENAVQESARILSDAEARAELVIQKSQAKIDGAQREIDEMRLKRREVETSLEATISTLRATLDYVREQDRRERGEAAAAAAATVVPHRPHVVHSA